MNAARAPMSLCVIEADVLHSQTTFYEAKTDILHWRGKSYNTELVL